MRPADEGTLASASRGEGAVGPVIVAGDSNTSAWSPRFRNLVAATGLRDAEVGQGWIGTWPAWFRPALVPIDHVLVKGPVAVVDLRREPFVGSDHYPLVADLRLYGGGAAGRGPAATP